MTLDQIARHHVDELESATAHAPIPPLGPGRLGVRAAVGGLALALVAGAITMAVFLGGGDIAEPDAVQSATAAAAVPTTTKGPTVRFPVDQGRVSAYLRGPAVCSTVVLADSEAWGCRAPELWHVPAVFAVDVGWSANTEGEIEEFHISGFGPPEGMAVVVEFIDGTSSTMRLIPADADFPYKAFTGTTNGRAGEIPTLFRVVNGEGGTIAEFDYQQYVCVEQEEFPHWLPSPEVPCD